MTTPAAKTSLYIAERICTHTHPSGTPTSTPMTASPRPSSTTSHPTCPRCAPTARSIASVRWRSVTPIDSALNTMNVAASIDTVPPR
jgi:hypothetical protein